MKKLILIASLLMAGGLWAEQKVCELNGFSFDSVETSIKLCKAGDILAWDIAKYFTHTYIVSRYCHQEKQISVVPTIQATFIGVCTYTGKKLESR
tara:strand:+ start:285 stop:569 length:285 start_codon:yes stop_codon:yes gene_type:complete